MFRTIADFTAGWAYESEATLKVLRNLTDASLSRKATPDGRTLGFMAWHLTLSLGEMMVKAGLPLAGPAEDTPQPATAAAIAAAYEQAARSLAQEVPARWSDETLLEVIDMYGEQWSRGQTLLILILHQTHHRAQMTVLMRMAGLPVPGVYGPSREEWAQLGLPPMP